MSRQTLANNYVHLSTESDDFVLTVCYSSVGYLLCHYYCPCC